MALRITVGWSISLTASFVDGAGYPAPMNAPVTWHSSDNSVISVVPDATGYNCLCLALHEGAAQVRVEADVDPSATVVPVNQFMDFVVVPAMAVKANLTAGEAVPPQPATYGYPAP